MILDTTFSMEELNRKFMIKKISAPNKDGFDYFKNFAWGIQKNCVPFDIWLEDLLPEDWHRYFL